jgi:hypothetical protein
VTDGYQQQRPVAVQQTTVIQVGGQKNVVGAVLLALFFGPLGMLYSTVVGALVMFVVSIMVAVATLGLGLIIIGPICAIWAGMAASSHNNQLVPITHTVAAPAPAPAGWHADPHGSGRLRYYDGLHWTDHYADGPTGGDARPTADEEPLQITLGGSRGEEETAVAEVVEFRSPERKCDSCGAEIGESDRFCPACGNSQTTS